MVDQLPDSDARRRAATDFRGNFVVMAGAGTGKTSLLVERALNAIGSGVAGVNEIGAITFTEKAAGEMRERLALGLERLRALTRGEVASDQKHEADRAFAHLERQDGFSRETLAARALEAMELLDSGTVMTIHGFCAELLRTHPMEAAVDPDFVVDSGELTDGLLSSMWIDFVVAELGLAPPRAELWHRLLSQITLAQTAQIAWKLSEFDIPPSLLTPPWSAATAIEPLEQRGCVLAGQIEDFLARQTGLSDLPTAYFVGAAAALRALAGGGLAAFRVEVGAHPKLQSKVEAQKGISINTKLEPELVETAETLADRAKQLLNRLWRADDETPRLSLEASAPFALAFREQSLRKGFVGFDGLLSLARDLLRDHPEVRRQLKRRYRLLLVDEFQDTDPLQYEIVLYLAEVEGESAEAPFQARLDPGRLFVVGDAKQSIYRFRGADYSAFSRAVARIVEQGGSELHLVANFRTVPDVIEPVNELFEHTEGCWNSSSYQPDYVAIEAARCAAGDEPRVELWTVKLDEDSRNVHLGRRAEGRLIANQIARWVREEGLYEFRDITILLRAMTDLDAYLRPLRALGIPFVVDGGKEFLERPEIAQLMATFRTLTQPNDETALLAFLRSPSGAVSDVELAAYAEQGGAWDWRSAVDAGRHPGIARCFSLLADLERTTRHLPADAVVRRILDRTLMLPLGAAGFEGAQRVANLQKLAAAAGELARDGRLSLEDVVEALSEGKLEEVRTDRPLADDAASAVRISTIHRMKGLENTCIVIPDLARTSRTGAAGQQRVAMATLPDGRHALALKIAGALSSAGVWHELEDQAHDVAEEVRVLYVALTRAKERLVLLARDGRSRAPWIEALAPWGYSVKEPPGDGERIADGKVLHRHLDAPSRSASASIEPLEGTARAVLDYERAVAALRSASRNPFRAPSDSEGEPGGTFEHDRGPGREFRAAVGRVLHRLLEHWDGQDRAALEGEITILAAAEAIGDGLDAASIEQESKKVARIFLESDLSLRFTTRPRIGREVPLLLRSDEGSIYRGSIDLLYEDDDGSLVVADYKTDAATDPAELVRRHGKQLRVYSEAARRAFGLKQAPRAELWMLRSGDRVVIGKEEDQAKT